MYRTTLVLAALALRVCGRDPAPAGAPVIVASPTVAAGPAVVPTAVGAPAPVHGGRVQIVGNYAVETVAARTGGVALFVTDRDGHPIAPEQVNLQRVHVDVNGHPTDVPVRVVNGALVANVAVPADAVVAVTVPYVVIAGVPYENVAIPGVVVVAALPGIIVVPVVPVVAPVVIGFHGKHRKFHGHFGWH